MRKLFKIITGILLITIMGTTSSLANSDMKIKLLGKTIKLEGNPIIESNRTLVPVRSFAKALGSKVTWHNYEGGYAEIEKNNKYWVYLYPGKHSMAVSYGDNSSAMTKSVYIDTPAVIKNGKMYLPARAIAEGLGYSVKWDNESKTMNISGGNLKPSFKQKITSNYDPYQWNPHLKREFEEDIVSRGYVNSAKEIKYKKIGITDNEGYLGVYIKYEFGEAQVVSVNVKTGAYRG